MSDFKLSSSVLVLISFIILVTNAFITKYADKKEHIVGGVEVEIRDFPYQVSIRKYSRHFCGGSIISDRHILTAAHCAWEPTNPNENYCVKTGTSENSEEAGRNHKVQNVTFHPEYFFSKDFSYTINDVAIITLVEPMIFDCLQKPVNLPKSEVTPNTYAILSGWGKLWTNMFDFSSRLNAIKKKIWEYDECTRGDDFFGPGKLCAQQQIATGFCHGDSGSPLVVNNTVVGIASYLTHDFCGLGLPDIYTNVFSYLSFIEDSIAKEKGVVFSEFLEKIGDTEKDKILNCETTSDLDSILNKKVVR